MRAVFVNASHPDTRHVSGTRIPTFARLLADRGHHILLLTGTLEGGEPSFASIAALREAIATRDWARPLLVAVPPQDRAVNRAIRSTSTPAVIRKALVAWEFLRHDGVRFDWTAATFPYWDAIARDFDPEVTWGTFGDSDTLRVTREIALRAGAPWGIDVKDPWRSFVPAGLRRIQARRFADAGFLTTNSLFTKAESAPWFVHDAQTIYSGAPASAFEGGDSIAEPTVVLMGSIYSASAFEEFARGLASWLGRRASDTPVRFVYAGVSVDLVRSGCRDLERLCSVEIHRYLGLDDLMALCRNAMLNCYIASDSCFHHKVIELLCCGRPVLCYPGEAEDEEQELARSVGARYSRCQSVADIESALESAENGREEPRNRHEGLRAFHWEVQGLAVEDALTRAATRCAD